MDSANTQSVGPQGSTEAPPVTITDAVPEETPPNLKAVLEEARQYYERFESIRQMYGPVPADLAPRDVDRLEQDRGLSTCLTKIKRGLAEVRVEARATPPSWLRVRLNTTGARFDAIRFECPAVAKAGLLWACATASKGNLGWGIVPEGGRTWSEIPFKDFFLKRNLVLPELPLPNQNSVVFQQVDEGLLNHASEYFLWFAFEDDKPWEFYVKLKAVRQQPHFTTAHPIAKTLGFNLPLQFSEAATLADRGVDLAEYSGVEAGLEFLSRELEKTSDRAAEFRCVRLAHDYALKLSKERATADQAGSYFQQAATGMRTLREKYGELSFDEARMFPVVLYNEACHLALAGKPQAAFKSLQEAFENGFRDVAQMRGDDDLESVRQLPEFADWLKNLPGM